MICLETITSYRKMTTSKTQDIGRRHAIPVIYTRGTHYDVGFDIVRIQFFLTNSFRSYRRYIIARVPYIPRFSYSFRIFPEI